MSAPDPTMTFVVRITVEPAGRLTGVVERVRTGERHRVHDLREVVRILEDAVRVEVERRTRWGAG